MLNRKGASGTFFGKMCRAPDDGMGGAAPAAAAPAADPAGAAPAAAAAPAGIPGAGPAGAPPAAPAFDPEAFQQLQQNYGQVAGAYQQLHGTIQQMQQEYQRSQRSMQEMIQKWFDPEGYERAQQPQYMTRDQFRQEMARVQQQENQRRLMDRVSMEMPEALRQFPKVAEVYGDQAPQVVFAHFVMNARQGNFRSVADVARFMNERIEGALSRAQQQWVAGKTQQQQALAGTGNQPPAAPPPTAPGPSAGPQARGIDRFAEIDVEKFLRDAETAGG